MVDHERLTLTALYVNCTRLEVKLSLCLGNMLT